jgi:hypothetical protein
LGRDGEGYKSDLGETRTEIFLQPGMDRHFTDLPVRHVRQHVGWVERSDTHRAAPCCDGDMTDYRRNFIAGGSFFFTVNLAERRLRLLTEHIDELRNAFRETRRHQPFTIAAMVVLVGDWPYSLFHRMVKLGVYPEDWAGDVSHDGGGFWRVAVSDGYRCAPPILRAARSARRNPACTGSANG